MAADEDSGARETVRTVNHEPCPKWVGDTSEDLYGWHCEREFGHDGKHRITFEWD